MKTCWNRCNEFHELRGISSENLMYIKEDLIIPHVSVRDDHVEEVSRAEE